MIMDNRITKKALILSLCGGVAFSVPSVGMAQQLAPEWSPSDDSAGASDAAPGEDPSARKHSKRGHHSDRSGPRVEVTPYIEAQQVVFADLKNGGDVLTYSSLAAGVDASVQTQRAEAQVNVRYEHVFGYNSQVNDQDVISGLARGSVAVGAGFSVEAGGIATRSKVDGRGASPSNLVGNPDNITQVYSVYAGPTYSSQIGDLSVNAAYRAGYTKVENRSAGSLPGGQQQQELFDHSVSHSATASVGMQPGALPIGWSASVGYDREDAGLLDQRYEGKFARVDITVPITPNIAAVGGAGYEKIEISERDAQRDVNGVVVRDANGRLLTNKSSPRLTAYQDDGVIWDVGVMWRPSNRTSLVATYGHRYGSDTYTGSFSYVPNDQWAVNVSAYDTVSGFGHMVNNSLANLPTQFRASRNPLSGDLGSCAFGSKGGFCFNDALQSASAAAFRSRGVTASLSSSAGGWDTGYAVGYNQRKFIASRFGAQATINGQVDENYFAAAYLGRALDQQSRIDTNVYANYFDPGFVGASDVLALGVNAAYYRQIFRGLSATAAVGLDSYKQKDFDSALTGSALVGLRYSF
jgi:hypothetical protein